MIQSLDRAILIMDIVANAGIDTPTLKYITEKSGLNKSTCAHLIETLMNNSLLLKVSASKGYKIGPHAYMWAKDGRFNSHLVAILDPILKWLNKKTEKATLFATIVASDKYLLNYYESDTLFKGICDPIIQDNIYNSATGLHLLSRLHKEMIYDVYKKHGLPNKKLFPNIINYESLLKFLEKIKTAHIYKHVIPPNELGDYYLGYSSIIELNGSVLGSIGVACRYTDIEENKKEEPLIIKYLEIATRETIKRLSPID